MSISPVFSSTLRTVRIRPLVTTRAVSPSGIGKVRISSLLEEERGTMLICRGGPSTPATFTGGFRGGSGGPGLGAGGNTAGGGGAGGPPSGPGPGPGVVGVSGEASGHRGGGGSPEVLSAGGGSLSFAGGTGC